MAPSPHPDRLPSDPALWPAHEQARQIAAGQLSAAELLEACVRRWREHDGELNAIVCDRLEAARGEASAADDARRSSPEASSASPLHGVPATVKEAFDVAGLATTWGAVEHANHVATRTAEAVRQLQAAGAVIWGKTNVPRRLGEWQTFNDVYGETLNPWDRTRTPGGSSGGSAVAIAMGYSALELGSDIGGSIRFPAHYCGVYGHKPSFGAVSPSGHDWPGQLADVDINVCGPIARSATDLRLSMQAISQRRLPSVAHSAIADFTVGVMLENPYGGAQDTSMTEVLHQAVELLGSAGVRLVAPPERIDHRRAHELYLVLNHAAESNIEQLDDAADLAGRYLAGDRSIEACVGYGGALSHAAWLDLVNERASLRQQWADWFGTVDLLLCPVSASAAPPRQANVPFFDQTIPVNGVEVPTTDQWFWAGIASGSYLPATAFPVGQTASGLPVGLQALGPFGNDLLPIRFAELAADVLGGWKPPALATASRTDAHRN